MDRTLQVFFLFCLVVFFFTGCGWKETQRTPAQGPGRTITDSKSPDKPMDPKASIDLSQLPEKQRKSFEYQAQDIQAFLNATKAGSHVFQEVWKNLLKDPKISGGASNEKPLNVFKMVHDSLSEIFAENGLPLAHPQTQGKKMSAKGCDQTHPVLKAQQSVSSYVYELSLTSSCPAERANANSIILATLVKEKGDWVIRFVPENLTSKPNALGLLGFRTSQSSCRIKVGPDQRLIHFSCADIGHNVNAETFIHMNSFLFNPNQPQNPVKVMAKLVRTTATFEEVKETAIEFKDEAMKNTLFMTLKEIPQEGQLEALAQAQKLKQIQKFAEENKKLEQQAKLEAQLNPQVTADVQAAGARAPDPENPESRLGEDKPADIAQEKHEGQDPELSLDPEETNSSRSRTGSRTRGSQATVRADPALSESLPQESNLRVVGAPNRGQAGMRPRPSEVADDLPAPDSNSESQEPMPLPAQTEEEVRSAT